MKNRGFTLIELLAVIVITGVLSIMIVPKISNIMTESKMKMYVQDAKKLLTQAQYRMSANNSDIDKPENGECIIFSLNFLAVNDFRNPPNNGKYMDESSFVVVKNEDGQLEYAVMLVEHRKDGLYQGVEFVTEKQLNSPDALKHVRYFDSSDIRYIDPTYTSGSEGSDLHGTSDKTYIDSDFINQQLRKSGLSNEKWLRDGSVTKTYNVLKNYNTVVADAAIPTFTAKITSNNTGGLGVLDATLTIAAEDADDPINKLTVCYRAVNRDDGIYPSKGNPQGGKCVAYGNSKYFTDTIDFEKVGLDYDINSVGYVYITVTDPAGHSVRKLREYVVHKNDGPVIYSIDISKRDEDKENMPTAKVSINVADDITPKSDLMVCLEEDTISYSGVCSNNYVNFLNVFPNGEDGSYTFHTRNSTPDGSKHSLTIYVMDNEGKISYDTAYYDVYNNKSPSFSNAVFSPIQHSSGLNSLDYSLSLSVTDDLSNEDQIMIKIGDYEPMTYAQYKRNYLNVPGATFNAGGVLNGEKRNIIVKAWDHYQTEESATYKVFVLDNVFREAPPSVSMFKIIDAEPVCTDATHCLDTDRNDYGAYKVKFNVNIYNNSSNQEVLQSHAKICISENKIDCEENEDNLANHYITFTQLKNFVYQFSLPADGKKYISSDDVRTLYVNVVDNDNLNNPLSTYNENPDAFAHTHQIYYNKPPEISEDYKFTVTSTSNTRPLPTVRLTFENLEVKDDFGDYKMSICQREIKTAEDEHEEFLCTDPDDVDKVIKYYKSAPFFLTYNNGERITGVNKGETIGLYAKITDHLGAYVKTTPLRKYKLANAAEPYIPTAMLETTTSAQEFNSNYFVLRFVVIDPGDTFTLCLKPTYGDQPLDCEDDEFKYNDTDAGLVPYEASELYTTEVYYDGETLYGWDKDYHEEDPVKKFSLSVKDSDGNIYKYPEVLSYKLYNSCESEEVCNADDKFPKFTPETSGISPEACGGVCIKNENVKATQLRQFSGKDKKTGTQCYFEGDVYTYCDDPKCFKPTKSNKTYKYLGVELVDKDDTWTYTEERENIKTYDENNATNIACNQLVQDNNNDPYNVVLFNSLDTKCQYKQWYCQSKYAENACRYIIDFSDNPDMDEYSACVQRETSSCELLLNQFCSKPVTETYQQIKCDQIDYTNTNVNYVTRYCDQNTLEAQILGGQCYENSTSCYYDEPVYDPNEDSDTGDDTSEEGSTPATGPDSDTTSDSTTDSSTGSNDVIGDQVSNALGNNSDIYLDISCTIEEINNGSCGTSRFFCSEDAAEQGLCQKSNVIANQSESLQEGDIPEDCQDDYKVDGVCLPICKSDTPIEDILNKKCTPDDAVIYHDKPVCKTICYKVMDCTPKMKTTHPSYECTGYYREYRLGTSTEADAVILERDMTKRHCPQFVNSDYRQKYFGFDKGYIVFDESQVKELSNFTLEEEE